jgi:hypothetical protein
MVFVFQLFALLAPIDRPAAPRAHHNSLLELHAALSVMAYGAFALGFVAGVMYLVQERQLKSHKLHSIFFSAAADSRSCCRDYATDFRRIRVAHGRLVRRISRWSADVESDHRRSSLVCVRRNSHR